MTSEHRWSTSSTRRDSNKFPDFEHPNTSRDYLAAYQDEQSAGGTSSRTSSPHVLPGLDRTPSADRWQAKRDVRLTWSQGYNKGPSRHGRQKSLSDAIRTIRTRKGSVSANAQEIAEALKAPISVKLIVLCLIWYTSSALTNTSSKSILTSFPKPITLTLIQFIFVSSWCIFFAFLARVFPPLKRAIPALKNGIRRPSRDVIATTFPLALFQIGGHILSSTATEKIPVSLVHTIKGLSPLFTVLAYRFIFHIHYGTATYLSLIPLTLGVILACSVEFSGNLFGILCAFAGALIFVTQNIFSKKLFNQAAEAEADNASSSSSSIHTSQHTSKKLDKLNLLCYCSGLAFLLTLPLWFWTDGLPLFFSHLQSDPLSSLPASNSPTTSLSSHTDSPLAEAAEHNRRLTDSLLLEFCFNGIFHFAQNILAFILLSLVSPVTYSVASLIKRVFVIVVAIVWFGSKTTGIQALGIALTFLGLYLYDRNSDSGRADRRAKLAGVNGRTVRPLLPLNEDTAAGERSTFFGSSEKEMVDSPMNGLKPAGSGSGSGSGLFNPAGLWNNSKSNGTALLPNGDAKKQDAWRPGSGAKGEG